MDMDQSPDFAPALPLAPTTSTDEAKAEAARLRRIRADPILDKLCRYEAGLLSWEAVIDPSVDPTTLPKVPYKRRVVLNEWPAIPDPDDFSLPLIFDGPHGKQAPNGWPLWGASLYNFCEYVIRKECFMLSAMSTTSKLAAWSRRWSHEYPDWARSEIETAADEPDPARVHVYDINKLLLAAEDGQKPATKEERDMVRKRITQYDFGREALVDLETHRPALPFSTKQPSPKLEDRLRMLPEQLIVHDPWNTLSINDISNKHQGDWTKKKDVVRKYRLHKSTPNRPETLDNKAACLIVGHEDAAGHVPPAIHATSPEDSLDKHAENKTAHLYLDPTHKKGEGNHSSVYEAELEVARSLVSHPELCDACVMMELEKRWDLLDVFGITDPVKYSWEFRHEGEELSEQPKPHETNLASADWEELLSKKIKDFCADLRSGDPARLPRNVVNGGRHKIARMRHAVPTRREYEPQPAPHAELVPGTDIIHIVYPPPKDTIFEGPAFQLKTQEIPLDPVRNSQCPHGRRGDAVPVARVRVAAKLSHQGDTHLANEANAYGAMPVHLSQHWSGFNIRKPLRAPTPLGAVVPQCFGYYVPEKGEGDGRYMSAILLVEDCGDQVEEGKLNEDDRHECADMYMRMHQAGWVHGSVFPRNTVVQKGPLYLPPEERTMDEPSFRVIDFGRSMQDKTKGAELRWREDQDVLSLFQCGHYQKLVARGDLYPNA